ncbi:hypothetical protein E3G68_005168 [Mycobacteroides abscessus]|uniref:hypothetical protein n=1 Tax=Mycobacteroides abscessus TaxID=36809 RepID=UPI0018786408|nr:hypothetical protein [Mycobacteroides abscessus]
MTFSDAVDASLAAARQLLGDGAGPEDLRSTPKGEPLSVPANWTGPAADHAATTTTQLDIRRTELAQQRSAARPVIAEAAAISRDAHKALDAVESSWAQDKAVFGKQRGTAYGQSSLLQAGAARVNEAQEIVRETATRFAAAAQRLPAIAADYAPGKGALPGEDLRSAFESVGFQTPPPQAGFVTIWCAPDGRGLGFICKYLWPNCSVSSGWSQWDLTGGQPC